MSVARLSRLGLGTVQFGLDYGFSAAKDQGAVDEILGAARDIGINFVDTARAYGDSETKIGDHLRRNAYPGLMLATKLAPLPREIATDRSAIREHVVASVSESRAALGRDPHIVLVHQADDWVIRNELFWQAVRDIDSSGAPWMEFGISAYDVPSTRDVLRAEPSLVRVIEIPYNVFDRRFAAMANELARLGTRVVSRSAFLKGLIPLPTVELPAWAADLAEPKRRLEELAAAGHTTVADLALRCSLRPAFIESTIVGVDTAAELREDARSLTPRPDLDPTLDELERIQVDPASIDPRRWLAFGF